MNKSTLSLLTILSIASLTVTLFLANTTAKYDMHTNDALSFQAPHLQNNNATSTAAIPRRNLSEAEDNATDDGRVNDIVSKTQQVVFRSSQKKSGQPPPPPEINESDNRPSGVVYQYIPPPPINITARSLLSSQIPKLVNIDAPITAALCGIVKDAEPYLDEWYVHKYVDAF